LTIDLAGRTALVTGGTMGIGLETAVALAAQGARCAITYKWGSADESSVFDRFSAVGGIAPLVVRADAANDDDTRTLMAALAAASWAGVDMFVSNVSAALIIGDFDDYDRKALGRTIDYSAWPLVAYLQAIHQTWGTYPRHVVALSSTGVDRYCAGYDFMAASKALLEALCRYVSYRLRAYGVRINVVRSMNVRTQAFEDTFSREFAEFAGHYMRPEHMVDPREVAEVVVALGSGLMDGMNGQVITVDRGMSFFDDLMRLYAEREQLGLR
jgi:NAD(P)-dependent dehydrogenase (short-subunit alcohol dehydrogenase family)